MLYIRQPEKGEMLPYIIVLTPSILVGIFVMFLGLRGMAKGGRAKPTHLPPAVPQKQYYPDSYLQGQGPTRP